MIYLTNRDIKSLVKMSINEAVEKLNVRSGGIDRQKIMGGITLYHRPKDSTVIIGGKELSIIDSLFTYGFSREFTRSNGGNMYGAGVYTVYNLKSSTENATSYGRSIIMLKLLGGYQDFLLFSMQKAQEIYGNGWKPGDQIRYLFPDMADEIFNEVTEFVMHDEDNPTEIIIFDKDGNKIDNPSQRYYRSADTMYRITSLLGERANNGKCRGWVYNGGHDGDCCVIMDFQSAVPVAVSTDDGQTWKNGLTDDLIERLNNDVDTHFQFGSNFKDVADKSINGYTMVFNDEGKINYIPSDSNNPISDVWFDEGFNWTKTSDGLPFVEVKYEGYELFLVFENGEYQIYSPEWELQCTLEELPSLI